MTDRWQELCMAEDLAYFKGDMVLDSPESYTAEEMWEVVMEILQRDTPEHHRRTERHA